MGLISHGKWSRRKCYAEAQKYKSSHEFCEGNGSAYAAALRNGWMADYTWFVKLWEPKWNKESCYVEAQKYKTRGEFQRKSRGAYEKSRTSGWLDEFFPKK